MKLIWLSEADTSLRETARRIQIQFGTKSSREFLREVRHTERLLRQHPNLGPIEPLQEELPKTYRSIVVKGLNKMVYRIDGDTIIIADFWDVRRDPESLAAQVK